MIPDEAVEFAYRLILGREPENDAVVRQFAKNTSSLAELRRKFFASSEFKSNVLRAHAVGSEAPSTPTVTTTKPLDWKPIQVEVSFSDADLAAMIRHIEATWEDLGRLDPHWSMLIDDKYRAATIEKHEAAFYATGEMDVTAFRAGVSRYGIALEDYRNCFELGCGVGRVTRWLAPVFRQVLAADVSAPHLELARKALEKYGCRNVKLLKLGSLTDLRNIPEFDVFYSVLVLQHNPPPMIAYMLKAIMSGLRRGGIGYFQIPTYSVGYEFSRDYLRDLESTGTMEMHVLPQNALFEFIQECGCQLLEVREDGRTGSPTMISNSVLVRKR